MSLINLIKDILIWVLLIFRPICSCLSNVTEDNLNEIVDDAVNIETVMVNLEKKDI